MPKRKKSIVENEPKKKKVNEEKKFEVDHEADLTKVEEVQRDAKGWPQHDVLQLLENMRKAAPLNDKRSYKRCLQQIHWEDVTFKTYSVQECKNMWEFLAGKITKTRNLEELIADAKKLLRVSTTGQQHKTCQDLFIKEKCEKYNQLSLAKEEKYKQQEQNCCGEHSENRSYSEIYQSCNPPPKPKTPYELFIKSQALKSSKSSHELWHSKSEKEKYVWIKSADEQYKKYKEQLKAYLKEFPNYKHKSFKNLTRQELEIRDRLSGKPHMPPYSNYHLYLEMMKKTAEVDGLNMKEFMILANKKWQSYSTEEKEVYQTRLEQMRETYKNEVEDYLKTVPPGERDKLRTELYPSIRIRKRKKATKASESPTALTKIDAPIMPPATPFKCFLKKYKGTRDSLKAWQALTDQQKKEYEDECVHLKKEYITSYELFLKTLSKEDLQRLATPLMDQYDSSESEECDD